MGYFSTTKEMIVVSVSHVSKLSRKCPVLNTVSRLHVGEMGIFLNQFTFSEYISEQPASPKHSDPF